MSTELTIILIVVLGLLAVYLLVSFPLKKFLTRKLFRYRYYHHIYKYVDKKDYRLINNFVFKVDENTNAHFDHVVFGEKYIYLITDKYWSMGIYGKIQDPSWLLFKNEKNRIYVDNPLAKNELRTKKISLVTGIDQSLFVAIVVVNNDCLIGDDTKLKYNNLLIKEKVLIKTIEEFESSEIPSINDEQLQETVYKFDKLNLNKKGTSN